MSKHAKLILAGALVLVALGGALAALLLTGGDEPAPTMIRTVLAEEIAGLTVSNQHGTLEARVADGGFSVADIAALDAENAVALLQAAMELSAVQVVDTAPGSDLSAFGLDSPRAAAEVRYADGSSIELRLGNVEPVSGHLYAQCSLRDDIYLLDASFYEPFLWPSRAFVSRQVTPALEHNSPLSAVLDADFYGGELDGPLSIEAVLSDNEDILREALSFGAVTHIVRMRGVYELDQTYGIEILGSLLNIQADEVYDYNLTEPQLRALGFDEPYLRVEFDLKNGPDAPVERYELRAVHLDNGENGQYLLHCNQSTGTVYVVQRLAYMDIDPEKLPLRWYVSPMIMDLSGVSVRAPGVSLDFALSGESNAERAATLNGSELDIAVFRSFYGLLSSASHDGVVIDSRWQPDAEALLRIEYHYSDPLKSPDVLEFYAGDARRVYVAVNGVAEYGMREMYVTRVLDACERVIRGEDFEVNW